jgi:hypothetical protein
MVRELISVGRRNEVDLHRAEAGAVVHTVEPVAGGGALLRRSGLLLTRQPGPGLVIVKGKDRVHEAPTRAILASACARVLSYPAGLLSLPAEDVIKVLAALRYGHLLATYGAHEAK